MSEMTASNAVPDHQPQSLFPGRRSVATRPPWTWPMFTWQRGEGITLFWIVLIHAVALIGVAVSPMPSGPIVLAALALLFVGGLGTTVAYHRALAHHSVTLHWSVEAVLIFAALFNGSGAPDTWAANHRLHHAKAETPEDISSPRIGGFMWSHLRWLWQAKQAPIARWTPDLSGPRYRNWRRWQVPILAASFFVGAPFGWTAFFWLGPIRLVYALHAQMFVNSVAHMKPGVAAGVDSSQNLRWLGVVQFFQGENWHGNHHANPGSARLGQSWRQPDLGWTVIQVLKSAGLASKVRTPRSRPDSTNDQPVGIEAAATTEAPLQRQALLQAPATTSANATEPEISLR